VTVEEAVRAARAALGRHEDGPAGLEEVWELIAALAATSPDAAAVQAVHEERMASLRAELAERTGATDRVLRAIASLRAITAPPAMLQAAAKALADGSRLDRVVLSVPRDGALVAEAVHVRGEPEAAERLLAALRERPVTLGHPLLETEALRRRRATLVPDAATNARVDRATADVMRWSAYVVAPVAVRSTVVAVLHADRGPGGDVEPRDASVLWTFASGLAQAYESASLRRTLRGERRQMRQLLTWLDARSGELADASIGLVPRRGSDVPLPEEMEGREERRAERKRDATRPTSRLRRGIENSYLGKIAAGRKKR